MWCGGVRLCGVVGKAMWCGGVKMGDVMLEI